jgi:hypothetical protein
MNRIADPIAAQFRATRVRLAMLAIAGMIGVAGLQSPAQSAGSEAAAPKPATYSGCVQKAPDSATNLVISTPTACAKLAGKIHVETLAGHEVELTGILTPRTATTPASIQVDSVGSVGKSCSDVCSLQPPRSRGLHPPNSAVPGTEGGTPGVTTAPPQ